MSLKSRLFNFFMRNRHLLSGKLTKEEFDSNTSIVDFRSKCEKGAARFGKIPDTITVTSEVIAGIPAEWVKPENAPPDKLIFYVHGGGYVSGSCNDHRSLVCKLADRTGMTYLQYEYRLAPEFPFPAALNDSIDVYCEILKSYQPNNILIAGESAGGGLTLAMLLALKEKKLPMPAGAVAISPWTDLTCSSQSYHTKNKVSVAPKNSWTVFSNHYVGNNNPKNPLISPLFGDLRGLPPIYINAGESDELFEDGEKFYQKAKATGVNISFKAGTNMIHCYPLLAPLFPEATSDLSEIVGFVAGRLKG